MLAASALWFRYQDDPVPRGLTPGFSAHAATGLVEANSCGKSTLSMNLNGLLHPQQDTVMWQGKPLDYNKRGLLALCQQVATASRDLDRQISYTGIDSDVAFSLRDLGMDEAEITWCVEDMLTLIDVQHFHHQPIQRLSHGQKKRITITGALVLQTQYLLLDEPVADLDPPGRMQMAEIVRHIVAQGSHAVISSHDIDLIYEVSDAVYVLRQGEVLTHGTPGGVFVRTGPIEQAGLTQPWLVKLYTELGFLLYKTEAEFLSCM